jgi:tryptophan-rich sensory protein
MRGYNKRMNLRAIIPFVLLIGLSLLVGYVGSVFTLDAIPTWYALLQKPAWTPPNWVFGPVWTTLYVLMGAAAALVWNSKRLGRSFVVILFLGHLVLNLGWSIAFFAFHMPVLAMLVITMLWISIVVLMLLYMRYSRRAVYLMVPYLLWVTYASSLNLGIIFLNS